MLQFGMTKFGRAMYPRSSKTPKPGGWLKLGESIENVFLSDERPTDPPEDWAWPRAIRAGGKRQRLSLDIGRNQPVHMEEAGFVDVRRREYKVPFWKGWEKEMPGSGRRTEHVVGDN